MDWALRSPWVAAVARASNWAVSGQQIGHLDDLMPVVSDGVLTMRAEWDAVHKEERENK